MNEADVIAALDSNTGYGTARWMSSASLAVWAVARSTALRTAISRYSRVSSRNSGTPMVVGLRAASQKTSSTPSLIRRLSAAVGAPFSTKSFFGTRWSTRAPGGIIATQGEALTISLAHKRRSQGEAGATVLDGALVVADPAAAAGAGVGQAFVSEIAVARQPRADLFALYQGWMDTVVALLAAQVTGTFSVASSPEMAASRRAALTECARLDAQLAKLRVAAGRERQVARQVELNLKIKRMQAEHSAARAKL